MGVGIGEEVVRLDNGVVFNTLASFSFDIRIFVLVDVASLQPWFHTIACGGGSVERFNFA